MAIRASRDARAEKQSESTVTSGGTSGLRGRAKPKTISRREMQRMQKRREKAGDLLEIIRTSETAGRYICYRYCE